MPDLAYCGSLNGDTEASPKIPIEILFVFFREGSEHLENGGKEAPAHAWPASIATKKKNRRTSAIVPCNHAAAFAGGALELVVRATQMLAKGPISNA